MLFTLHGAGEDRDDCWRKYFKAGKVQVAKAQTTLVMTIGCVLFGLGAVLFLGVIVWAGALIFRGLLGELFGRR